MIVKKLFTTQKKVIQAKPVYQKPKFKTYRQLLQLDRPRKQIQYQSSSQEEDFLEKLLKQQNKKQKKPKSSSRKQTSQSQARSKKSDKNPQLIVKKKAKRKQNTEQSKERQEDKQPKKQDKIKDQIQTFLAQNTNQTNKYEYLLQQNQSELKSKEQKPVKSKSTTLITKNYSRLDKSKTLKKDMRLSNPILIDTKSIESPPIIFTSANHNFNNTMHPKHTTAYEMLMKQKHNYQRQYKTPPTILNKVIEQKVKHTIQEPLPFECSFQPNIDPLYPNWRISMTINPLAGKNTKRITDRKSLFKSDKQQQRFIQSLRELSKFKR